MAKYGFLIDNRKCIGCHACTVACKQEHDVPLGKFRTWVKYIEKGEFPSSRRHFSVMRCNHCERPPCVDVCPVTALFKRDNGIVDFDAEVCIGCKACMQACPYDALHIDPESGSAQKCNFCAHRIEVGREPPCVTVCPEQAIVMGDLDDPASFIRQLLGTQKTTVRAPEKATRPQLHYIEGDEASLQPLAAPPRQEYIFSTAEFAPTPLAGTERARPVTGRRTYDISHDSPWGWKVSAYLWTKAIASGCFVAPAAVFLWNVYSDKLLDVVKLLYSGSVVALLALFLTCAFLVWDLKRPHKFLSIMLRPQWKSWLVKGAFVLSGYAAVLVCMVASAIWVDIHGPSHMVRGLQSLLLGLGVPLAVMTASYTAFLFAQCEARDLWHSPMLPWHLAFQGLLAGSSLLLAMGIFIAEGDAQTILRVMWMGALILDLVLFFPRELSKRGHSAAAQEAAALITRGIYAPAFWVGAVLLGHILPLGLLLSTAPAAYIGAAIFTHVGLIVYEHVFVMAGQAIPLS